MSDNFSYDNVIVRTVPAKQPSVDRVDIRVETKPINRPDIITMRNEDGVPKKARYFVVDHEEKRVIRMTMWDYLLDGHNNSKMNMAYGFKQGYKDALEIYDE